MQKQIHDLIISDRLCAFCCWPINIKNQHTTCKTRTSQRPQCLIKSNIILRTTRVTRHPFNKLFSVTTWISSTRKVNHFGF